MFPRFAIWQVHQKHIFFLTLRPHNRGGLFSITKHLCEQPRSEMQQLKWWKVFPVCLPLCISCVNVSISRNTKSSKQIDDDSRFRFLPFSLTRETNQLDWSNCLNYWVSLLSLSPRVNWFTRTTDHQMNVANRRTWETRQLFLPTKRNSSWFILTAQLSFWNPKNIIAE